MDQLENQATFAYLFSRLERRSKMLNKAVPGNYKIQDQVAIDILPIYTCTDLVKCKDFDIEKVKFKNFENIKKKIVSTTKVVEEEDKYCDMV